MMIIADVSSPNFMIRTRVIVCFCLCDTLLTIKNALSHYEVCKNHQEPDLATLELVLFAFRIH